MAKILVQNTEITIVNINDKDYISLTDMVRNIENGLALIERWLRNKNTIEFLGIWESMYNPGFNSPEFEGFRREADSIKLNQIAIQQMQVMNGDEGRNLLINKI